MGLYLTVLCLLAYFSMVIVALSSSSDCFESKKSASDEPKDMVPEEIHE